MARELVRWLIDNDMCRRGLDGVLIVNPNYVQLSTRITATEYMAFRDVLDIPKKYKIFLYKEYVNETGDDTIKFDDLEVDI